jgi:citrate lyase beta subunit
MTIRSAQSFLFVPADERHRVTKAAHAGADAVILDLEDAVSDDRKTLAREVAAQTLRERPGSSVWLIRVNGADSAYFAEDVALVADAAPDAVVIPKADPSTLAAVDRPIPPIVALIETAAGLANARAVAVDPRVVRLQLGAADLALELNLRPRTDGLELLQARAELVLASALADCAAPIDSVFVGIRDLDGLKRDVELGRSLGFSGKACIHPTHIEVVHRVYSPTPAELARATALLEAFERGAGAGAVEHAGAMIDRPIVEQARRIIATAQRG